MARRIIPLKYKKSPFKIDINSWTDTTIPSTVLGITVDKGSKNVYESQFEDLKKGLIGMDVSKNFYEDLVNPYAGLTDQMAGLENTAEDLTINQKAFTQQNRMLQQGLSDTLEQSKRTGTQSAQAIANQLTKATGDISAGVGEQERQNQLAKASQAGELQKLKAQSAQQLEMQKAQGEFQVDMQKRKGDEDVLSRRLNKQQALLSLVSGEIARKDQQEKDDKGWLTKVLNVF